MELATWLFRDFNNKYLHKYQIWSKTCFPYIPPPGIKVLGEEAYTTYPAHATEESTICQNVNKLALSYQ